MRAVLLAAGLLAAGPAAGCQLALALAVDVSGSVNAGEYRQQMDGLATALADPQVGPALIRGRSAVTLIQWTDARRQAVSVPWTRVSGPAVLAGLVARIADAPRIWDGGSTAIGAAVDFSRAHLGEAADCRRRVIDVSADGRSNQGRLPSRSGIDAAAEGVTVNGLAILGSEPYLTEYFAENVIAGPGAFVMTARGYFDYPAAIRRKLIAEVAEPLAARPLPGAAMAGERR